MNLPNYITMTRVLSIPLFMWVLLSGHFSGPHGEKEIIASAIFICASITDGIRLAEGAIDSGAARHTLERMARSSQEVAVA